MMVREGSTGEKDDRDAQALYEAGIAYLEGDNPHDLQKAIECLETAAEGGMADAYNYLGFIYGAELGGAANEARAFTCYCKGGEAGNIQAMLNAAACLADGAGVKPDSRKALYWYEKAAHAGNAEAAFEAGDIYDLGEGGVEGDMEKALAWYLYGAERGCEDAMYRAGHLLYFGIRGVQENPREGFDWLRKAVENDAGPYAVLDLGVCHWERNDEDSLRESIRLFEQALAEDVPEAHKYLGICYLLGRGVDRDAVTGIEHLKKGAKGGDTAAALSLAECYTDGIGVEPSPYWAEYWYKKAIAALPKEDRATFRRNNPFPLNPPSERDSVFDSIRNA